MECVKYFIKRVMDIALRIFYIFPVDENRICFISEHSYTFGDNLKYLALHLKNSDVNCQIVFIAKDFSGIKEAGIIPLKFHSLKHFYYALTSSVVITNRGGVSYLPIRGKQLVINTWHGGGPYKKSVGDIKEDYWYTKENNYNAKKINYILSSCKIFSDVESKGMGYTDAQCINCGQPKVDLFFKDNSGYREKIYNYYHIDKTKHLVLYAPTYRGEFTGYDNVISDEELELEHREVLLALENKFGGNWVFALRLHPRLKKCKVDCSDIVNMTEYPDVQEILLASDALITDYSSIIWDFSFSKKPCFVYAKDIEEYSKHPGFYIDYHRWPYLIAESNEKLIANINTFRMEKYLQKLKKHYAESGSFESGHACETCEKIIKEHMGINK